MANLILVQNKVNQNPVGISRNGIRQVGKISIGAIRSLSGVIEILPKQLGAN
jgi:hypothetical protein